MTIPDLVGLAGVGCYVIAYTGLQLGRLTVSGGRYTWLNLAGGTGVIYSLLYRFNLASLAMQLLWFVFTIVGYVRVRRADKQD